MHDLLYYDVGKIMPERRPAEKMGFPKRLRICASDIHSGKPWSIFQLQSILRMKVITNQIEHNMEIRLAKSAKAA
jgi:hypothetical protein